MTLEAPWALPSSSSSSRLLKFSWFSSTFRRTVRQEIRKKPAACCFSQQQQQHHDDAASPPLPPPLHVEVSPSALRSLQPQDPNSSSKLTSESLIERNLRKRAMARQASSSLSPDQRSPTSVEDMDDLSSASSDTLLEKHSQRRVNEQGSSTLQDSSSLPADVSTVSRDAKNESSCSYGASNPFPITTAFWQEAPSGFSTGNFHSLDFHVLYFRFALLLGLALSTGLLDFSFSSLFWLLVSPDVLPNATFLFKKEDDPDKSLLMDWSKDASEDLERLIDDKKVLSETLEVFSAFWSPSQWIPRAESGKARDLVAVLAYSTYVHILSGAAGSVNGSAKKLEDLSASLKQTLVQLHGPLLDPLGIWEKALKGFSDVLDGRVFVYEHALIFPCMLPTVGGRLDLGPMLEDVQYCLDKEFKNLDMVALLQRSSENSEEFFLVIAPWYWTLAMESAQFTPLPTFLAILSIIASPQFTSAGLDLGFSWEPYGVSVGWSAIVASMFLVNHNRVPVFCPFPSLGAIGKFTSDLGIVPSRQSLVSTILKVSCAPLAISLLLTACGITFWGPTQYSASSVVDFHGYVLVPPDFFSYSGLLTKLLQIVSVATVAGEDGKFNLAASPLALAGLLGLNFTAFTVFPGLRTDGSNLLRGLLGNEKLAKFISFACTMALTGSLATHNLWLCLGLLALSFLPDLDFFVKDDVSEPDLLTRLAGFSLVAGAVACLIPLPQ